MLLIPCPWCGPRAELEFAFGGERCDDPAQEGWPVVNRMGRHQEEWVHKHGCRQWFVMERDTTTHEIYGTRGLDEH